MENKIIDIYGKKINYQFLNLEYLDKNTCLVFLHDGLGSVKQWNDFPLKISNELKLPALLYDRIGHGESADSNKKRDRKFFQNESDFLNKILSKLNICVKVILIGSSDGGTISLVYASLFPDKVKGIITIAAHTFVEEETAEGVEALKEKYEKGNLKRFLNKFHSGKTDNLFYGWSDLWLSEKFRDWNIYPELKKIKCPLLAIQGSKDEYGTEAQLKTIYEYMKSECIIKLIEGAGHFPYLEKEKEVVKLIEKFISEKLSGFFKSPSSV
jgi:pimeloyl-ACP methyl ester carboxylesterase